MTASPDSKIPAPRPPKYAARLNSFRSRAQDYWPGKNRISVFDLIGRAAAVKGLGEVDLNYPDHVEAAPREIASALDSHGLSLNGFAMRYYGDPAFRLGAFTHPDPAVRRKAIDLTKRGIDALRETGGDLMTLWLGQDGFDYTFGIDYRAAWELEVAAIAEVCAHDRNVRVSIEYKPNEPRAFSLLSGIGTTLLAIREANAENLGVTLDFAHVLYAGEMPAFAAMLAGRHARLFGVHLNDSYGKRDDGLMAGSVHVFETLELLMAIETLGYGSAIYFDTFPDAAGVDPVAECETSIASVEALRKVAAKLRREPAFAAAVAEQDAVAARRIVMKALYG